jgi:hypothetical protein
MYLNMDNLDLTNRWMCARICDSVTGNIYLVDMNYYLDCPVIKIDHIRYFSPQRITNTSHD